MTTNVRTEWNAARRMCAIATVSVLGLLGATLGGCSGSNSALLEANRALTDQNTRLTQENQSLNTENQRLQAGLTARDKAIAEQNALLDDMRAGRGDAMARLDALNKRFGDLRFGDMDPTTDTALRELAAQHSDMLEWDSARGLLRFKSDLTFGSGSDVVSASAQSTLMSLAGILNGAAAQYDIRIVGHTDSQRMSPGTAQKHTSNIRLSADRAISVRNELVKDGVMAARFEIAGRGEFDPMVPNSANGNTPQNRRVEIFLVKPMGPKVPVAEMAPATRTAPTTRPTRTEEIMK